MTTPGTEDSPAATQVPETPGAKAAAPTAPAAATGGFTGDMGETSLAGAARAYVAKIRGGDPGALPAILGLVVLLILFSNMSKVFLTTGNLANIPAQAAPTILIAMGLVFVLLLAEIDLSAGTAAGVCATTMALALTKNGDLHAALKGGMYGAVVAFMLIALGIAVWMRLWPGALMVALGTGILLTHLGAHVWIGMFLCITVGTAIGLVTGFLRSPIGIPSFVVTLALFLAWQGIIIQFEGQGNAIATGRFYPLAALAHHNVAPGLGWAMLVVFVGGYGAVTLIRSVRRRSQGLSAEPLSVVTVRFVALAAIGTFATYFLNTNRQTNPKAAKLEGMPWVVPVILVLLVVLTLLLTKTQFGRHLYAVGGNAEAARRAGINVGRMRVSAFAMCTTLSSIGGLALASYSGGVPSDIGSGNTLLYAVGAAVIGGTSLFGGRGRIRDAVLGGLVIALIPNGLGLKVNLGASYTYVVTGAFLLVAAAVDALSRKRQQA
jgi:D-xylose transport system permease protein